MISSSDDLLQKYLIKYYKVYYYKNMQQNEINKIPRDYVFCNIIIIICKISQNNKNSIVNLGASKKIEEICL